MATGMSSAQASRNKKVLMELSAGGLKRSKKYKQPESACRRLKLSTKKTFFYFRQDVFGRLRKLLTKLNIPVACLRSIQFPVDLHFASSLALFFMT